MPTLHELERAIASAIVNGNGSSMLADVVDDAPGAAARLAIHANHYRVTLTDALASTFPVVHRLVGSAFFAAAARQYVRDAPPAGPCLFEYGAAFPEFLARFRGATALPWLGDVAALEWAITVARHAADVPPAAAADLHLAAEGGRDVAIGLHPGCGLVVSAFPIDQIWNAHQAVCDDIAPVALDSGGACFLVHRRDDDVGWLRLTESEAMFVAALIAGDGMAGALPVAANAEPAFDPSPLLAALLSAGQVVSITPLS